MITAAVKVTPWKFSKNIYDTRTHLTLQYYFMHNFKNINTENLNIS